MKTTLLFLSFFLSVSLFGQKLQIPNTFKLNETSNEIMYEFLSKGTKKDAVNEVLRILKMNQIDTKKVKIDWNLNHVIWHQENVHKPKKMWIFHLFGYWQFKEINKYKISIYELSNKASINFGSFVDLDGKSRFFITKPFE